ncbi:MAG: DUF2798 domain-containing protein [Burkholderiales bacterium]|nr:DUF2798 domain-containing protein [Burkholderiales bacterium]
MIPRRFEPFVFGFTLSGLMSFVVSGIATLRLTGLVPGFPGLWLGAWLTAWVFAFPAVLFVAPVARRIVNRMMVSDGQGNGQ